METMSSYLSYLVFGRVLLLLLLLLLFWSIYISKRFYLFNSVHFISRPNVIKLGQNVRNIQATDSKIL